MLIQGERVGLAALEPSAAASLHAWMHEPELRRLAFMEFNFPQPTRSPLPPLPEPPAPERPKRDFLFSSRRRKAAAQETAPDADTQVEVAPRRDFIVGNALKVANLDV